MASVEEELCKLNEHVHIQDQQLCKWAPPQYTDTGATIEKTIWQIASLAVATINTLAQIQMANQRMEIAEKYRDIAQERLNRFRNNYVPLEYQMLGEITSTPEPTVDYNSSRERPYSYVDDAFTFADDQISDLAKKYNLCMDISLLDDLPYAEQLALDDGVNYTYRDEEYFRNLMSDLRWNRRSNLLNIGRENMSQSVSYAQSANNALAEVGQLANSGAQGAMQMLGYMSQVKESVYPSLFTGTTINNSYATLAGSTTSAGVTGVTT